MIGFGGHGRKERGEEKKCQACQEHVTFITGKVIGIMTTSIARVVEKKR